MTNLNVINNVSGSIPHTYVARKFPDISSSHGKVLYVLAKFGMQTAHELIYKTGYLGAQERTNELPSKFGIPICKKDTQVQMLGRIADVKSYSLDWNSITANELKFFISNFEQAYGKMFS